MHRGAVVVKDYAPEEQQSVQIEAYSVCLCTPGRLYAIYLYSQQLQSGVSPWIYILDTRWFALQLVHCAHRLFLKVLAYH